MLTRKNILLKKTKQYESCIMLWHTKMNPNVAQLAPKLFELAMQTNKFHKWVSVWLMGN